jgi:ECF sigma factor
MKPARAPEGSTDLDRLAEALEGLAALDPELAGLVDLKFFCGFSFVEIAGLRGVSGAYRAARLGEGTTAVASRPRRRELVDCLLGFTTAPFGCRHAGAPSDADAIGAFPVAASRRD